MDAEIEMQEYSQKYMSRGRRIVGRIFSYTFRVIVFGIIAIFLWRVLLSDVVPRKARTLLVNEATYQAYLNEGNNLDMYTQEQEKLSVTESIKVVGDKQTTEAHGLFWVSEAVFIPGADQVQILTRYNNSTLRRIATDFKLDAVPDRQDNILDVTLVVTTDPTPTDIENGDEFETRYAASDVTAEYKTAMYNYCKYIFDGITVDPETTVDITAEFYYAERVNYDSLPYSFLRIYDSDSERVSVKLTARDKKALGSYTTSSNK